MGKLESAAVFVIGAILGVLLVKVLVHNVSWAAGVF